MAAPLGLYTSCSIFIILQCFPKEWYSVTVDIGSAKAGHWNWITHWKGVIPSPHLKAEEMCGYQTGPINPLNNPLSLLCIPILLMPGPLLASCHNGTASSKANYRNTGRNQALGKWNKHLTQLSSTCEQGSGRTVLSASEAHGAGSSAQHFHPELKCKLLNKGCNVGHDWKTKLAGTTSIP